MQVPFQESGAAIAHIQDHHQFLAVCLLADMGYLYCTNPVLLNIWNTFFLNHVKRMRFLF